MKKTDKLLRQLASNVRDYLTVQGESARSLARNARLKAKRSPNGPPISARTLGHVMNETHPPKLESVAAIGRAIGVPAWQLLIPGRGSAAQSVTPEQLDRLVTAYLNGDSQFRDIMDRLIKTQEV